MPAQGRPCAVLRHARARFAAARDLYSGKRGYCRVSLNKFGYQQQLRRELRVRDLIAYGLVFMVVIAPFGIFGSVYQASGGMIALAYVVGAAAMILTASSYGVMVEKYPVAGSVYGYAGRAISPAVGFLT